MIIGRLLMRFLLVPLGGGVAICVATLFVMVAQWNRMSELTADDYSGLTAFFVMVPVLAVGSGVMLWPATLGALLAEIFAIRSWMYHASNGGLSAAVSLVSIGGFEKDYGLSNAPLIAVGAGIVADSNPEAEYEETLAKARGFMAALRARSTREVSKD